MQARGEAQELQGCERVRQTVVSDAGLHFHSSGCEARKRSRMTGGFGKGLNGRYVVGIPKSFAAFQVRSNIEMQGEESVFFAGNDPTLTIKCVCHYRKHLNRTSTNNSSNGNS